MTARQEHALVIGGSGMLRGLSLSLARRGWRVSVIARTASTLREMEHDADNDEASLRGFPADYVNEASLDAALEQSIAVFGSWTLVVLWVHSRATGVVERVGCLAARGPSPVRIFEVVGSAGRLEPGEVAAPMIVRSHATVAWRRVVLGFIREPGGPRWLTHDEICRGIEEAVMADRRATIVGLVDPWSRRPGA